MPETLTSPAKNAVAATGRAAPVPGIKVMMLGLRGFPNVQGGVENHAQNLSAQLTELGCDVNVLVRGPYVPATAPAEWRGVRLTRLWAPQTTGIEAIVHTFIGVLYAGIQRPDVLHIHAIGPGLFTPLARALGLRVVVTHHSQNYDNEKWGGTGQRLLRLGERLAMRFASSRIAVSEALAERMRSRYGVEVTTIANGIPAATPQPPSDRLAEFGLKPGRYILNVARIDQQKRQLDLIQAFAAAKLTRWTLALVGGADYRTEYTQQVEAAAKATPGVVMLGHQTGPALAELFTNAGVFALPSSHEGQPIAALEALSYGCPLIASNIPAVSEIAPEGTTFVTAGDIPDIARALTSVCGEGPVPRISDADRVQLTRRHDWRIIAEQTLDVYRKALKRPRYA